MLGIQHPPDLGRRENNQGKLAALPGPYILRHRISLGAMYNDSGSLIVSQ